MKMKLRIPVLAMRKEASHKSELISQILFGEEIEIIEKHLDWFYIKTVHDDYRGWIENKKFYFKNCLNSGPLRIISSFSAEIAYQEKSMHIPFGAFFEGNENEILTGDSLFGCEVEEAMKIITIQLLGAPYLWGGRTGFGIDCSGLTQLFFRLFNIKIPRDAYMQANIGDDLFLSQVTLGDLLFYKNSENKIVHVGIAIDHKFILHSSGNVRIDEYDETGIFNRELKTYTHLFALAKRIKEPG